MKKIIYFMAIVLSVACSDSFIELTPLSTVSVELLYKTDKDFQDAIIGGYNALQTQYRDFYIFGDVRADDSEIQVIKTDAWSDSDLFILNSSSGIINSTWRNYYIAISRMNMVLNKIESADASIVTNKNRYIGEAKFLRALAYFDLVRIFGNVPLITKPITTQESYETPREKVDVVYELIISDLLSIEQDLPASYSGSDIGRVTKGAAKSLLGKVYLTRHDFAKAESKLREVTAMGYELMPNFKDLFDYSTDEHHSEYIFDIEYAAGNNISNTMSNRFAPNSAPFLAYYGVKGIGGEANSPTEELRDLFDDSDARKDVSVAVYGGFVNGSGEFVAFPPATSKSYTKKYLTATPAQDDSDANWKVIRYADVLLMYAEALNENGKTDEALSYLNMVRTRAEVPIYSGLSQHETREAIYTERRLELCFEGHRWFDLLRYGRAYETLAHKGMKPFMTLFPVPLTQIQVINNSSVFAQNEGYNYVNFCLANALRSLFFALPPVQSGQKRRLAAKKNKLFFASYK
jgi:tetratricopeptide (TPR) repeat protein